MRSAQGGYRLEAPELLDTVDEIGDGISLQILAVFPGFVLQQIMNSLAVRQVLPKGVAGTELVWTCFGYANDDETMTERRLKQANLIGPAGFISHGGRRRHGVRAARRAGRRRPRGVRRDGRARRRLRASRAFPRPRCAACGRPYRRHMEIL